MYLFMKYKVNDLDKVVGMCQWSGFLKCFEFHVPEKNIGKDV